MNLFARVNNNEVIYEIVAAAAAVRSHVSRFDRDIMSYLNGREWFPFGDELCGLIALAILYLFVDGSMPRNKSSAFRLQIQFYAFILSPWELRWACLVVRFGVAATPNICVCS